MSKLKRSSLVFIFLLIFGLGIFVVQKVQASKTLAEQLADLKAEALKIQNQLLQTQGYVFIQDLKLGDRGKDVLQLQKFLNSDLETQVSLFGLGSLGQETDFFGNLTLQAVIKFQDKYANEVLRPANLFFGTGYVGPLTRSKLNSLTKKTVSISAEKKQTTEKANETTNQSAQNILDFGLEGNVFSGTEESERPIITFVSNYSGPVGSSLTVYGAGFTEEENIVHLGDRKQIPHIKSSGNFLTFIIPQDIAPGRYKLFASNTNGISENETFFIVTSPSTKLPEIISITPAEGKYGEEITIHGTGFTSTDNEIRSSYGIISNLKSTDGKTLKFKVEPYPETPNLQALSNKKLGFSWPINFYIVNDNGVGKKVGIFTLNL